MARCASASRTNVEPPGREVTAETETEFTVFGEYDVRPAVAESARRGEGDANVSSFGSSPSSRTTDAPESVASESSVSSSTERVAAFGGDPPFPMTRRGENTSRNRRNGDAGTGGAGLRAGVTESAASRARASTASSTSRALATSNPSNVRGAKNPGDFPGVAAPPTLPTLSPPGDLETVFLDDALFRKSGETTSSRSAKGSSRDVVRFVPNARDSTDPGVVAIARVASATAAATASGDVNATAAFSPRRAILADFLLYEADLGGDFFVSLV
mmetsp:Transcript_6096/g.25884  ORF Transcript_6096/g.25884 Transcript_6096/m.25884 type:complete len:272 (+) Transcript_6096:680-1495(+)